MEQDPYKRIEVKQIINLLSPQKITNIMEPPKDSVIDRLSQYTCQLENKNQDVNLHNDYFDLYDDSQAEKLSEKDQQEFEKILKNIDQKVLNLDNSSFKIGKCPIKNINLLVQHMKSNKNLQQLDLTNNELGSGNVKNIELIAEAIKSNKNLQQLNLSLNGLDEDKKSINGENLSYFEALKNGRKIEIKY